MRQYLVLIETSQNQDYIFSTNKLKENIGASELTHRVGTKWLSETIGEICKQERFKVWKGSRHFKSSLSSEVSCGSDGFIEILIATSGKAILLAQKEDVARDIVGWITRKSLEEAPGIDVLGVIQSVEDSKSNSALAEAIKKIHKKFERARSRRHSPHNRFLRLPIISSCSASELPASCLDWKGNPISRVNYAKREASKAARDRLTEIDNRLLSNIDRLEQLFEANRENWLAVIHADGNGLGQIFMRFEDCLEGSEDYKQRYREFSSSLDECTERAFKSALDVLPRMAEDVTPVVPLIIGGDDLTAVCDGQYALEFTRVFLQEFERQTARNECISSVADKAFGVNRLSACAGIAIVKPHFPFSVAYSLASDLIKNAKTVKTKVTAEWRGKRVPYPCSAIDFHILYDSSGVDLGDIRSKLSLEPGVSLHNRPYIVSDIESLTEAEGYDWAKMHAWSRLSDRIHWLLAGDSGSSVSDTPENALKPIPRSQSHTLRQALSIGKDEADAQLNLIRHRYDMDNFIENPDREEDALPSLFYTQASGGEVTYTTCFLDALDAAQFLEKYQEKVISQD